MVHPKNGINTGMVIWPEFRMRQYRENDHLEDAPHFKILGNVTLLMCLFVEFKNVSMGLFKMSDCHLFSGWLITFYFRCVKNVKTFPDVNRLVNGF